MLARLSELGASLRHDGAPTPLVVHGIVEIGAPADFVEFVGSFDGAEGWVGDSYVSLWPAADVIANNETIQVDALAPGLLLFGSDGGTEAYGFDRRANPWLVVRVPFVGLSRDRIEVIATSVTDWLVEAANGIGARAPSDPDRRHRNG